MTPPAFGWTVNDVIQDCVQNGKLTHDYPPSLIRKARNNLPSDVDEYTDCRDLLSTPSGGGGGSGGGSGPSGGSRGGGRSRSGSGGGSCGPTCPTPPAKVAAPPPAPPLPAALKAVGPA